MLSSNKNGKRELLCAISEAAQAGNEAGRAAKMTVAPMVGIRYVPISFLLSYGLSEASCISYPKLYTAYGVLLDTITPNTGVLPTVRCYPSFLTKAHGESIQILHEVKPYAQYLDLRNDYFLRKTK